MAVLYQTLQEEKKKERINGTGTKRMGRDMGEREDSSAAFDLSGTLHGLTLGHGPQTTQGNQTG